MRDDEIIEVEVDSFKFQGRDIEFIRVALSHINYDGKNNKRNNFTLEEVVDLVVSELEEQYLIAEGEKEDIEYFVHFLNYKDKAYKLVFEMQKDAIVITVITIFRQSVKR